MEIRSVETMVRGLNEAGVEYLIVGGLAVNAHGYERLTVNLALVIGLEPANVIRGLRTLQRVGYQMSIPVSPEEFADPALRESWRRDKDMIVLKLWSDTHRRTPVDVFVYEPFDFQREYASAARRTVFQDQLAPVVSYETLLKMKAEAGRDRDLVDIQQLRKLDPYR